MDRRTLHRALMDITGQVSGQSGSLECVVLDISLGGAMVKVDIDAAGSAAPAIKPDDFLDLTLECGVPVSLPATVVWYKGSILGLKFRQEPREIANGLARLLPAECFEGLAGREIATPRL